MDHVVRDLRYAFRKLGRSPGFTAVAVVSLALGIGANTAIFSVVEAVLLEDLPFEEPHRLVEVYTSSSEGEPYSTSSYPDYLDLREATDDVFTDVMASSLVLLFTERDEGPVTLMGEIVTENYFDVLGVSLERGRPFAPGEAVEGRYQVAVISHGLWNERFGGAPDAVGRTLRISGRPYTVIGVAPEEFGGTFRGLEADVWVPMAMASHLKQGTSRGSRSLWIKARLREGVATGQARAAVGTVGRQLARAYPETNERRELTVVPTDEVAILPTVDRALFPVAGLLMSVVGLVLLIACANLASFLLARAADRRKEIAVRLALGAARGDLVRQLLTETVLIALLGGAAGLLVARWTLDVILGFQPPLPLDVNLNLELDGSVLLFTLGVSVVAGLAFGLAPAVQGTNPDLAPTLKDEGGGTGGRPRRLTLRNVLVVGQVAVSLVLLVASSLFLRSLRASQDVDLGFDPGAGAVVWASLEAVEAEPDELPSLNREIRRRLERIPGVTGVARSNRLPLGLEIRTTGIRVPGVDPPPGREEITVDVASVGREYFDVMGIPILRGRAFDERDTPEAPPVAVVSQAAARRFWPGESPVGKTVVRGDDEIRIVGLAADTKVRTLREAPRPYLYLPFGQRPEAAAIWVVKKAGDEEAVLGEARTAVREAVPEVILMDAKTMTQHMSIMLFAPRMGAMLLTVFGGLALILAVVGLYGVVSYVAARRTREVGIRIALGADSGRVVRLVMKGGMGLVLTGTALGVVLALIAGRLVSGFLYGVGGSDPVSFVVVPLLMVSVAAAAAFVPARRAARVDPVRALRSE